MATVLSAYVCYIAVTGTFIAYVEITCFTVMPFGLHIHKAIALNILVDFKAIVLYNCTIFKVIALNI